MSRGLGQARELLGGEVELVTRRRLEQLANLVDLGCGVGDAGDAGRGGARFDLAEVKDRRIGLQGLSVKYGRRQRVRIPLEQHPDADCKLLGSRLLALSGHYLAGQQLLLGGAT